MLYKVDIRYVKMWYKAGTQYEPFDNVTHFWIFLRNRTSEIPLQNAYELTTLDVFPPQGAR